MIESIVNRARGSLSPIDFLMKRANESPDEHVALAALRDLKGKEVELAYISFMSRHRSVRAEAKRMLGEK